MASTTQTTDTTGHTTTHEGVVEHGAVSGAFPPLDQTTFPSQLFWLVIFFATLYTLLSKWVLPRFAQILGVRKDRIDSDLSRASALKDETEAALKAYEKSIFDARASAGDIAKQTRELAQKEAEAASAKLDAELAAKIKTAEDKIAKAKAKAMDSVADIAADSAADIVAQLTGAKTLKAAAAKAVAALN